MPVNPTHHQQGDQRALPLPIKPSQFKASIRTDGALELLVYGEICDSGTLSMLEAFGYPTDGMVSESSVKNAIDQAGSYSKIVVRLNSPGGDCFSGIAIFNVLLAQTKPVECYVDGIAASSASIIMMAGGVRVMGVNTLVMIHEAWCCCCGYAGDMRKQADVLDTVSSAIAATYTSRTGKSPDEIKTLMAAETWFSAEDAVKNGFCTAIAENPDEQSASAMAMARNFKALANMKNLPEQLKPADKPTADHPIPKAEVKPEPVKAEAEAPPPVVEPPPAVEPAPAADPTPKNEATDTCQCSCESCVAGKCAECSMQGCDDKNCMDCPMQKDAAANQAEVPAAEAPAAKSDLSLYEALAFQITHGIK
jgi:ATP-dependent protease ClpP protease subunit